MKEKLGKFLDTYSYVMHYITAIILFGIVLLVNIGVGGRYIFNVSWQWLEEVCRYLEILVVMMMVGPLVWEQKHIMVDIVVNMLPKKVAKWMDLIVSIITTALTIYLFYYGVVWVMNGMELGIKTNSGIFYAWQANLFLPFGLFFGTIICCILVVYKFTDILSGKDDEPKLEDPDALTKGDGGEQK